MSTLRGAFVSSTGTSAGKTVVTRALTLALRKSGVRIAALKPIETGCTPEAQDAAMLAAAAGDEALAMRPAWYRAALPASPYAVELETAHAAPSLEALATEVRTVAATYEGALVEGAGGLMVPLSRTTLIADLVHALGLPVLLVAEDRLGVLSHVIAVMEAAAHRGLRVVAIVLNQVDAASREEEVRTNRTILAERFDCPVLEFPNLSELNDPTLEAAASSSGLLRVVLAELDNV